MVGTDTAKDEIFSYLRVVEAGSPGYCHFPEDRDESYFKQLCAEKKITKYTMGVARQVYVKVSESARNEALDLRVYATAARVLLNPNYEKLARNTERKKEAAQENSDQENEIEIIKSASNKKKQVIVKNKVSKPLAGNFATNW